MPDTTVLREAAEHAIRLYDGLDHAHVAARAGYDELRRRFEKPFTHAGVDPVQVLDEARPVPGG